MLVRMVALIVGTLLVIPGWAGEPTIRNVDVRGLQVGGTTTVAIDGDELGPAPRLLLPFAAKQTLKPGGSDKKAVFEVTLAADVIPGYHHLRVVTEGGVSLPVVIGVDRLPQEPMRAVVAALPIALHGTIAGSAAAQTSFVGKAKQKVTIEIEANRLGSKLRPIVHLYSPKKLQLAWAWGTPSLFGDAWLEAVLPDDGTYAIAVHDAEYAAAAPSFFRLKIGAWDFIDQVFPPAVGRGGSSTVEVLGSRERVQLPVTPPKDADVMALPWPTPGLWSGPRPFVLISSCAEFVERPEEGKLQELPAGHVAVSGRLAVPYEEDRYRLAVTPGKKIRLEVFAERIGSPLDAALVVRNDKGDQLARGEDSPGTLDPVLEYQVPDKVTSIVVGVVDAQGRGGARGRYRLVVEPQTPGAGEFKLVTPLARVTLPIDGRAVVPIFVERRGYAGKIALHANVPGLKMSGTTIADGADGTLVTLERGNDSFRPIITSWHGRADGVERIVQVKGHPLERLQPWLATEFTFAPSSAKGSDFAVAWRDSATDLVLVPGRKLTLPIKVVRLDPKQTVRLSLVTSQLPPLLNNQPDLNKTIRQEKPIEVAAKAETGEVVALVPTELPAPSYDFVVQADLLASDKKVIATAYAPVRHMEVRLPVVVTLTGPNQIEASIDAKKGGSFKVQGKIERREGAKGDVALALTGLPAGAKAEAVTVKADASEFTVNVTLPPNVPAGELKGVKLTGAIAVDPKQPAVRVRSREVSVAVLVSVLKS